MGNPYFTRKKVAIQGPLEVYTLEDLKHAIVQLGGVYTEDLREASLIIYGRESDLAKSRDPYLVYPNAIPQCEVKIDDLLQEFPNGIEGFLPQRRG